MANSLNFLQAVREDDFIEYFIYPSMLSTKDTKDDEIVLKNIFKKVESVVDQYVNEYLWHRDGFKLIPRTNNCNIQIDDDDDDNNDDNVLPHLYGYSHYGDNIEDEWFIVYLLFQITKKIDGLIARIIDSDGEFLLIEAANYLPKWAHPDKCKKRVYIYQGTLHIVPLSHEDDGQISINGALKQICDVSKVTIASTDIQNSILNRLKGYPERIQDNLHSTSVYLPIGVAAILKHKPSLVAPAALAFCNRDSIDTKACRAMKYFPPETRMYTRITFTKCLYAMLTHSKYVPDKRIGWNLPLINSPQYKSHSLGVKLACGFEILVSQAKPCADVDSDKNWHTYLNKLQDRGYFKELLEHSRDYNDLLNKAKEYYIDYRDSIQCTPKIGQEILDLTKSLDYNIEDLKKAEQCLPNDDDDSWLNIDPNELEKMLQEQYGKKQILNINGNTDAANFTKQLTKFLNHVSDVEGVEFPVDEGAESPVRPPRGVKRRSKSKVSFSKDTKVEEKSNSNKVNFDPEAFTCALQNILDFMIPEDDNWDLDSDSDMSVYGEDQEVNVEDCGKAKNKMQQYMDEMDKQLASTTIGQSFERTEKNDMFDDVENFKPIDIDVNALKNMLESYQSQLGEAGPASNMLGPMGFHLEPGTSQGKCKNGDVN